MPHPTPKYIYYAIVLGEIITQALEDEQSNYHEELKDISENLNDFFHALFTVMPTRVFKTITGQKPDQLGVNQTANRLIMQFSNEEVLIDREEEE